MLFKWSSHLKKHRKAQRMIETQAIKAVAEAEVAIKATSIAVVMEEEDETEIKAIKIVDMGDQMQRLEV